MATKRIERLTSDQTARLTEFRDKWISIGLSTAPADWTAMELGVRLAYKNAGIVEPKKFFRIPSPMGGSILYAILNNPKIGDSVGDSVWASVGDSVWASVRDSVWDSVRASVRDSVNKACYGQHDADWLAFYEYFNVALRLKDQTERMTGNWAVGKSGGWWWPFQNACIISDRPKLLLRDDRGRLHSESSMAIEYRDGWGVYAIGGVRVNEQIVMQPETQTIDQIRGEQNEEIKRIRIERFGGRESDSTDGWKRFLSESKAVAIDRRQNDIENTREALVKSPDGVTILLCACPSTARRYALEVDPQIKTCEQAQSWLWSGSRLRDLSGRFNIVGRS